MNKKPTFGHQTYEAHHVIFDEGDSAQAVYIIKNGTVEIRIGTRGDSPQTLTALQKGAVFGAMALIENRSRNASAVTVEKTEVVEIPREDFLNRLSAMDPIMKTVIVHLVSRLGEMVGKIGQQNDVSW